MREAVEEKYDKVDKKIKRQICEMTRTRLGI